MTVDHNLLYGGLLIIVAALAFWSLRATRWGYVLVPALLLLSVATGYDYKQRLGSPILSPPPAKVLYIHHTTTQEFIIVWTLEGKSNKLYQIPYSREAAKDLEKAKDKTEAGQPTELEAVRTDEGDYRFETRDTPPEGEGETK